MDCIKKIFFIFGILTFFIFLTHPSYAFKFNVDSPKIVLQINPGEKSIGYITVDNYGYDQDLKVRVYVQDVVYLPDGTNGFLPKGSTKWSLADWIKIEPKEFTLRRNSAERVRYAVRVPADAEGGRYGVIFFEVDVSSFPTRFDSPTASAVRIGSIVLVTAKGRDEYKAELFGLKTHFEEDGKLIANCVIRNSGNTLIRLKGEFLIMDRKGSEVARKDFTPRSSGVLPYTSRSFDVEWEPGEIEWKEDRDYILQFTLDYGGESLLGGQTYFELRDE